MLDTDAVTGLLLTLSLLMALILVILAWRYAADIRGGEDEEQEDDKQSSDAEPPLAPIEILPVYTIPSQPITEENSLQEEQPVEVENAEIPQTYGQNAQENESSGVEALREGIALVMPIEDETGEMGVRYDRSFTAKLIQSSDEVKEWYGEIKNYLLSFRKVHARTSWGRESFRIGRDCFARLVIKGKTLCILLAIIPPSCQDTKYKIEDLADLSSCKDTPCLYRIKSNRRLTYAKELIDIILQEYDAKPIKNREAVDYYLPYEGTVDLIKRGLIKRKIVAKRKDFLEQVNSDNDGGIGVA